MAQPALPTYRTAASVLEGHNGSGTRLAGWTVLRTLMIAPPMMLVGVPAKQAFMGAGIASGLISVFTLLRIFNAAHTGLEGIRQQPRYRVRITSRKGQGGSLCVSALNRDDARDIVKKNLKKGQHVLRVEGRC